MEYFLDNFLKKGLIISFVWSVPFLALAQDEKGIGAIRILADFSPMVQFAVLGGVVLGVVVTIAILTEPHSETTKKVFFGIIVLAAIIPSVYIIGATVYKNVKSATGGPVHWHADFMVYKCGNPVDLKNPTGTLSNRVGTPLLHEHDDNRIHVEQAVKDMQDVSLSSFFETLGGEFTGERLVIPTNDGDVVLEDGTTCPDGQTASLRTFAYKTQGNQVTLSEIDDPASYILSPESQVPPGDCVIFELTTSTSSKTDRICPLYEVEIQQGNLNLVE